MRRPYNTAIDLCCGDPDTGLFTGRLVALRYNEVELYHDDFDRGCSITFIGLKRVRISRKDQFESAWYWSSDQHAAISDSAWVQYFGYGGQSTNHKSSHCRARAVRRLPIQ